MWEFGNPVEDRHWKDFEESVSENWRPLKKQWKEPFKEVMGESLSESKKNLIGN